MNLGKNYSTMTRPTDLTTTIDPGFITGFTDAEGCFMINISSCKRLNTGWDTVATFKIELHEKDLELLKLIQTYFGGIGLIYKGRNSVIFRVRSLEQIMGVVLPHFDKYSLITQKKADYLLFKEVVLLMKKKEHLTQDGLNKIVAIKSSLNNGLTESLNTAFPNIVPANRPVVLNQEIRDPNWVAGFTSGDGCFWIGISKKSTPKPREYVQLGFNITQHARDEVLLRSLIDFFGCGSIMNRPSRPDFRDFSVQNNSAILETIIPFFREQKILGIKQKDFNDWCKVADLIKNKSHLTEEGLDQIKKIKAGINSLRIFE